MGMSPLVSVGLMGEGPLKERSVWKPSPCTATGLSTGDGAEDCHSDDLFEVPKSEVP